MIIPGILFLFGLLCLIKGGDWFVDGASALARRFHLPELLIGATVVSVGTTLPEVMVSTISAVSGHGEIAYGNAIGSVICNTALIAAITVAVRPGKVDPKPLRVPVAFFFAAAAIYCVAAYGMGRFTRPMGLLMLGMFVAYMAANVWQMKNAPAEPEHEEEPMGIGKIVLLLVVGAALIALGANLLVDNGTIIAQAMGVPESVIALTFVALGTSLPELVTAITSLMKGHSDLSLGNVVDFQLSRLRQPLRQLILFLFSYRYQIFINNKSTRISKRQIKLVCLIGVGYWNPYLPISRRRNGSRNRSLLLAILPSNLYLIHIQISISVLHIHNQFIGWGKSFGKYFDRTINFLHIPVFRFGTTPAVDRSPSSIPDSIPVRQLEDIINARPNRTAQHASGLIHIFPCGSQGQCPITAYPRVGHQFTTIINIQVAILSINHGAIALCSYLIAIRSGIMNIRNRSRTSLIIKSSIRLVVKRMRTSRISFIHIFLYLGKFFIPIRLIGHRPKQDRRMRTESFHHFLTLSQVTVGISRITLCITRSIILLPISINKANSRLTFHIDAITVTKLQEAFRRRIMGSTDKVHIRLLKEQYIQTIQVGSSGSS